MNLNKDILKILIQRHLVAKNNQEKACPDSKVRFAFQGANLHVAKFNPHFAALAG